MNPQLRRPRDSETARAIRAAVERRAAALAEPHGLDQARVFNVLERTVRWQAHGTSDDASDAAEDQQPVLIFVPSLEEALGVLEPARALALFESEDLQELARHDSAFSYLTPQSAPLHTIDELPDLLEALVAHQARGRAHLLEVGHPRSRFSRSRWLQTHLADLYPVKSHETEFVRTDPYGDEEYIYMWWSFDVVDGVIVFTPRDYEEVPLVEGLDPDDAQHLESIRRTVLDAKVKVLGELVDALRRRDVTTLWPACLRVLTGTLFAEQAEFLLRMDRFYVGFDARTGRSVEGSGLLAGGLTDLLELIGHCEKELRIGTMDQMSRRLRVIPPALSLWSYYEAVDQPWRPQLDAALDDFLDFDPREREFWSGYRRRVNEALENEFYDEVVIRTRVKRKVRAQFEPTVRTFAEWQKAHLEATGALPVLHLSQPSPEPPREQVFRKEGEYWILAFEGRETRLRHRLGLSYVAYLLRRPGQDLAAFDLQAAVGGVRATAPKAVGWSGREQDGLRIAGFGDSGEVLDEQAITEFRRRIVELDEDLREAEENLDFERAAAAREQRDWIAEQLQSGIGLSGRRRKSSDAAERIRKAVSKAIRDAVEAIEREHPALGRHLDTSIRTGHLCRYEPAQQVVWET